MRILVLGAHGFLGSHIAHGLSQNHTILRAGISPDAGDDHMRIDPNTPDFETLIAWARPDVLINCSGAASVPSSFSNPLHDFTLNTVRTAQILEVLRVVSPQTRFMHLSSAAVYGNPTASPIPESTPLCPVSPYGWHKRYAEEICREYYELHQIPTISLRIFSAYGSGLRKQLLWDVYQKAQVSERIELFGTGLETRDFIHCADIVRSINSILNFGSFDGRAVNVASGISITVREAVNSLLDALGWTRQLVFSGAGRAGDPVFWMADTSYLQSLGPLTAQPFEYGVREVACWMLALPHSCKD